MSSFEQAWEAAGRDEDNVDPPDGAFLARLTDAAAFTGRTNGKNYVRLEWELREGPLAGGRFEDFKSIDHPVGLRITREKLVTLGLDPDGVKTIEELHRAIAELAGTVATISVAHDGQWLNVGVISARTGESGTPADGPEGAEASSGFAAAAGLESDEGVPY